MTIDTVVPTPIQETTRAPRRIAFRTNGHAHCGITRLVSPSDIGGLIKPFVFLDHAVVVPTGKPMFGFHPLLAHYSVHTSNDALAQGESEIRRIGRDLAARRRNGSARNA
jgi:hypothetical protein